MSLSSRGVEFWRWLLWICFRVWLAPDHREQTNMGQQFKNSWTLQLDHWRPMLSKRYSRYLHLQMLCILTSVWVVRTCCALQTLVEIFYSVFFALFWYILRQMMKNEAMKSIFGGLFQMLVNTKMPIYHTKKLIISCFYAPEHHQPAFLQPILYK